MHVGREREGNERGDVLGSRTASSFRLPAAWPELWDNRSTLDLPIEADDGTLKISSMLAMTLTVRFVDLICWRFGGLFTELLMLCRQKFGGLQGITLLGLAWFGIICAEILRPKPCRIFD